MSTKIYDRKPKSETILGRLSRGELPSRDMINHVTCVLTTDIGNVVRLERKLVVDSCRMEQQLDKLLTKLEKHQKMR